MEKTTTVLHHRIGENLLHVLLQLAANSLQQGTKKAPNMGLFLISKLNKLTLGEFAPANNPYK